MAGFPHHPTPRCLGPLDNLPLCLKPKMQIHPSRASGLTPKKVGKVADFLKLRIRNRS